MNKLKTIAIPCLITSVVGIILTGWVFPFVLALVLKMTLHLNLFSLITDGMAYFWAMSFLQMTVLIILYALTLLLLLNCFRGKERLVSLSFAFIVSASLLFLHRYVLHGLLLLELIIEVFLIIAVSFIILWRTTKQPIPLIVNNGPCSETVKH